ncbi:MAG: hypothetical protein RL021_130 [Bacteroidota bacterium]|jgi:DNA uptake protein ComE-like DNA-binding protein
MKKKRPKVVRFRLRWKDHFTFSVLESRGIFVLLVILSLEISGMYYFRFVHQPEMPEGWERLIRAADSLDAADRRELSGSSNSGNNRSSYSSYKAKTDSLFPFDPNKIGKQEWMTLGLSSRQADAVLRYRSRGGGFRKRSDLSRVSVISQAQLTEWAPFIRLPDTVPFEKKTVGIALDVNDADSVAFERLRGIGPSLAGRIVRFRERLGGFQSLDQLLEVYGMNDTVLANIRPRFKLQSGHEIRRIDINRCPEDSLRRHPYIGSALARQMVVYRQQHRFSSVEELHRLPLYSDEISRKLVPYLKVGD